jgi:hypothetical protein
MQSFVVRFGCHLVDEDLALQTVAHLFLRI